MAIKKQVVTKFNVTKLRLHCMYFELIQDQTSTCTTNLNAQP